MADMNRTESFDELNAGLRWQAIVRASGRTPEEDRLDSLNMQLNRKTQLSMRIAAMEDQVRTQGVNAPVQTNQAVEAQTSAPCISFVRGLLNKLFGKK